MAHIRVQPTREGRYLVEVDEVTSMTTHRVTATADDVARLGGEVEAELLIEESFRFLLEREPKEAILNRFDLTAIARYFPEYPEVIRRRLAER